jgi:prepilin-type N-terminal cleavage/methylation domain-containing protein
MRRLLAQRMERAAEDAGFTLMEVVVAMVLFAVFCAMSLGLLVQTGAVTRGNLQRTTAANLATEQIQIARSVSATDIPAGTITRTQQVKNTTYVITQTSKYLSADATSSVCDGSLTSLAYRLVTVKVTWPDMGGIQPVRQDTLKAVGLGSDGLGDQGALAVSITGVGGLAASGITVTLNNGSTTVTDENGCAVFAGVDAGAYTATLNTSGYVGLSNAQLTTKGSLGVVAGTITRGSISYDTARWANVTISAPVTGGIVPSPMPLVLSNSTLAAETAYPDCPASGTPVSACATEPQTSAGGILRQLYPAIYTVKLGACTETASSSVLADLTSTASLGSTVSVPVGAITVNLQRLLAVYSGTKTITITHTSGNSGCATPETYAVTAASGAKILLPYGAWYVSVPSTNTSPSTPVTSSMITLSPSQRTGSTTLTVLS